MVLFKLWQKIFLSVKFMSSKRSSNIYGWGQYTCGTIIGRTCKFQIEWGKGCLVSINCPSCHNCFQGKTHRLTGERKHLPSLPHISISSPPLSSSILTNLYTFPEKTIHITSLFSQISSYIKYLNSYPHLCCSSTFWFSSLHYNPFLICKSLFSGFIFFNSVHYVLRYLLQLSFLLIHKTKTLIPNFVMGRYALYLFSLIPLDGLQLSSHSFPQSKSVVYNVNTLRTRSCRSSDTLRQRSTTRQEKVASSP